MDIRYKVVKLLLADGRIHINVKINAVSLIGRRILDLSPVFDIYRIIYLASLSLQDLIKHGDNSEYDIEIILSKFFWWFRLKERHGITTSKSKDPFVESYY